MTTFGVLGPLEVRAADGVVVAMPGERQRRLMALLLANHGRVVSADALAEAVFADRAPANPAAALHNQMSRLRRTLGDGVLDTTPHGYRLVSDGLDADRFESLVEQARNEPARAVELLSEALNLWRGRAYAEFSDIDDVTAEAARLDELRCTATEERAEALVATGRAGEAVADLESFVATEPFRERAHAALMRALYATGRHADALDHYAHYSRHLADELGLEPSVTLQRLEIEILRHSLAAPTTRTPAALRPQRGPLGTRCGRDLCQDNSAAHRFRKGNQKRQQQHGGYVYRSTVWSLTSICKPAPGRGTPNSLTVEPTTENRHAV